VMGVSGADHLHRTGSGPGAAGRRAARTVGNHLQRAGIAPPQRFRVRTVAQRYAIQADPPHEAAAGPGARPRLDPRLSGTRPGGSPAWRSGRGARRYRRRSGLRPGPHRRRTPPAADRPSPGRRPEAGAGPVGRGGPRLSPRGGRPVLAADRSRLRCRPGRAGSHTDRRRPGLDVGHPAPAHPLEPAGPRARRLP